MFRNANIMRLDIFPISFLKQAYTFNRDKVNFNYANLQKFLTIWVENGLFYDN